MITLLPMTQPEVAEEAPLWRSYWDARSECRVIATVPSAVPSLWQDYLDGARATYRKHGVDSAVEYDQIRDGRSTSLVFIAIDGDGRVVGGVRAQGPYSRAEQSHAMVEWSGQPGQPDVHAMITDRLPFGVVEMKTGWVSGTSERRRELAMGIPRACVHAMTLLDAQYSFCTSGVHTLDRWMSTGSVVADTLEPVPYPDDRYRTTMLWWNRRTFADHAESGQLAEILAEQAQLAGCTDLHEERELATVSGW